jgi:pimeloyl-ACP methyl ester carboxylesterase
LKPKAPALSASNTIVFSHGNSFPAGTYRVLFEAWQRAGWRVIFLPKIGHNPAFPVTSNWPHLRDELLALLAEQAPGEKVHLVGHSLGGYVSMLVACKRQDLVASVVLLDAPLVTGWRAHSVHMAKLTGLVQRVTPGRVSRTRRHHWPSAADALKHYAAKAMFARWDPRVLRDYIACGIEAAADGNGVELAFKREIETHIYNTLPHHFGTLLLRHPPTCPVSFIGGSRSAEVRQAGMAATRAVTQGRIDWLDGTHLFPMEQPDLAAQAVLRALSAHASAGAGPAR